MNKLDAAISSCSNGECRLSFLERPKKRGNPSRADWDKMKKIIEDNIDSIPPNADFDEISQIVKELAKINGIPLTKWAVEHFTNRILDLYCCINYLCQLKTSDNCSELTDNEFPLLQSFHLCQFKKLTRSQQIDFLLSHVSLVKEICKQLTINK